MKTKIVYVLVSDEKDLYLEQAWLSVYSLRLHNPTAYVVVLMDDNTERSLVGKRNKFCELVTEIKVVDVPMCSVHDILRLKLGNMWLEIFFLLILILS